jgi:hypothetical protein
MIPGASNYSTNNESKLDFKGYQLIILTKLLDFRAEASS